MPAFALTIFTGAFLLFQVQPLIGKFILPWFGGGPGVWTTCMLFFQLLLLGGYAYAHFSVRWLQPRTQAVVHLVLLVAALAWLPITPSDLWKPQGAEQPVARILMLLAVTLGLPYFVLSSTGPLVQHWFSLAHPGRSPYRLYALSNAGSLLALVSYPFFFETHFTRRAQASQWSWGLVVYALCCGFCVARVWRARPGTPKSQAEGNTASTAATTVESGLEASQRRERPGRMQQWLWLLLPACASVLLLATTNKMCQDVAVIPFLWVLPLALYLLTFIIAFDSPRWYKRFPFTLALIAALGAFCWALFKGSSLSLFRQVGLYSGGLFFCCLVCHGELYRLRPPPSLLTAFYLMIAAGGALGGVFVAVVAPLLFNNYYELHWGLLLCAVLFLVVCAHEPEPDPPQASHARTTESATATTFVWDTWRLLACILPLLLFGGVDRLVAHLQRQASEIPAGYFIGLRAGMWMALALLAGSWIVRRTYRTFRYWRFLVCLWLSLGVLALAMTLYGHSHKSRNEAVCTSRNFYGVLTVYEHRRNEPEGHHFLLQHGRITHGLQFVEPARSMWPTTYYGEESGVGLALQALPTTPRRVGLVGLGTGTLSAYGRKGDTVRIYEINPQVKDLAMTRFTYLSQSPARVEVVLGDARLSLEREAPQHFDLLVLDAFSSDAIPVHLLTEEAFHVYDRHLKTNGVMAIHISNHYLDLEPVVVNLARRFNYRLALIDYDEADESWWLYSSTWLLLSRNDDLLRCAAITSAASTTKTNAIQVPLWTDDFASLFQILK